MYLKFVINFIFIVYLLVSYNTQACDGASSAEGISAEDTTEKLAFHLSGAEWDAFLLDLGNTAALKKVTCIQCPESEDAVTSLFQRLNLQPALEELHLTRAPLAPMERMANEVMYGIVTYIHSKHLRVLELSDYRFTDEDLARLRIMIAARTWPHLERLAVEGAENSLENLEALAVVAAALPHINNLCLPAITDYRIRRFLVDAMAHERRARGLFDRPLEVWFGNDPIEGDVEDICYHLPEYAAVSSADGGAAAASTSVETQKTWVLE